MPHVHCIPDDKKAWNTICACWKKGVWHRFQPRFVQGFLDMLSEVDWRLVFFVSVPIGVAGTIWSYLSLRELSARQSNAKIDWWGNILFGVGLTALLAGITYGIQPYGGHTMGWTKKTTKINNVIKEDN